MSKDLNVNLRIDADVQQAKAQIQDLQNTLKQVAAASSLSPNTFDTKKIKEGVQAAKELQTHLRAATDVNTGKLNLSAFSASLKTSGKSLAQYKTQLEALGPAGEDAFLKVSRSIATANAPLRKTNQYLTEFATTLKNTARWQISSSILHGFMGSVQSAYRYAKDLNESLTDIRIVTGQNADQMAEFAEKANKAAKALSATTNQYAKASLIYYQQGLDDQEVQDRADITIKMAHASGQSAEIVSDQLTAVWNNFAKGGENLEHYADVMTALGAATASSSDEIAGGLEKFASIADMIGLSYEYAASALATITATTRQSEDVVGTALKTIFARIQGLKLGETLDDGTDLNKYSEALQKIGISIFEQNGELKNMDNILYEMGAKWETLSKDQQVALAQTVAGVRQYNQLVSLMDGWDIMLENVALSLNSDGTLNEQAEIYAESWEGASNRVRAAAEGIYQSLLDDDFFIALTNGFATLLEGVDGFVEGLGGMEGVLSMLGAFITQKLAKEAPVALNTIKQNLMQITGQAHQIASETQKQNLVDIGKEIKVAQTGFSEGTGTAEYLAQTVAIEALGKAKQQLIQNSEKYNSVERATAEQEIADLEQTTNLLIEKAKQHDILREKTNNIRDNIYAKSPEGGVILDEIQNLSKIKHSLSGFQDLKKGATDLGIAFRNFKPEVSGVETEVEKLEQQMLAFVQAGQKSSDPAIRNSFSSLAQAIKNISNSTESAIEKEKKLNDLFNSMQNNVLKNLAGKTKEAEKAIELLGEKFKELNLMSPKAIDEFIADIDRLEKEYPELQATFEKIRKGLELSTPKVSPSQFLMSVSSAAMQLNAVLSSMTTLKDVFSNEDATMIEKLSATIGALTSIMFLANTLTQVSANLQALETGAREANILSVIKETQVKIAAKVANYSLLASQAPLIASMAMFAAAAIGLAAVIWGVSQAIEAVKESSEDTVLNKLTEEADQAKKAFQEANAAYNDLISSIDKYSNADEALKGLTKGTIEYNAQLLKSNEAALELINTLGLIHGIDYEYDGSKIEIDQDRLEKKKEESIARANQAQAYSMQASQKVRGRELEVDIENYAKSVNPIISPEDNLAVAETTMGATMDKYAGEYQVESNEATEEEIQAIYTLADAYEKEGNIIFDNKRATEILTKEFGDKAPELADSLLSNDEEIQKLIPEIIAQKEAVIENTKALVGGANNDNEEYNNLSDEDKELADILVANNQAEKGSEEWNSAKASVDELMDDPQALQKAYLAYRGLDPNQYKLEQSGAEYKLYQRDQTTGAWGEKAIGSYDRYDVQNDLIQKNLLQYSDEAYKGDIDNLNTFGSELQNVIPELTEVAMREIIKSIASGDEITDLSSLNPEQFDALNKYLDDQGRNKDGYWDDLRTSKSGYDKEAYYEKKEAMDASLNQSGEQQAEALGIDVEEFKAYRDLLRETNEEFENNVEGLNKVALANKRMEKGVKSLADDWEDFNKIMTNETSSLEDISSILPEVNEGLQDILNLDSEQFELLPPDFAQRNWDLIQDVMNNVEGSVDALRDKAGQEILMNIEGTVDADGKLKADLLALHDQIASYDSLGFKVGAEIDDENFIASCNAMIAAAGMTADQAEAYFASMGYDVKLKEISPEEEDVSTYSYYELDEAATEKAGGVPQFKKTPTKISVSSTSGATAYALETITPNGSYGGGTGVDTVPSKGSTSGKSKGGGGGGGGGSKSKPAEKVKYTKEDEVIDRYKEIDDTLSDIEDTMSDINKLSDRLYGASRISQMEKEKKLLLQQADALKEKTRQAKFYLEGDKEKGIKGDRQKLIDVGADVGITWEFSNDGDILNYTSAMEKLFNELHTAEVKMDGMATKEAQDEFKEDTISKIEEKIEKVKDALSKYEDTKELIKDLDNQLQEAIWAWQDKNFEVLEYKLELKLDIEDQDLQYLDYLMNKWSDDFFKLAESAALMYNSKGYDQVEGYGNQLENYREHEQALKKDYEAGNISQADYIEGLKNVRDGYYENLNALIELDKTMMHFYEDSLAAGVEELADYTDHMEHLTGVFDHYLNLMDILGKSKDYEAMGDFLEGRAETLEDQLKVSKDYYEILVEDKAKIEKELNNALRSGSEEDKKYWKEQWDAIVDAVDEAQDQMLSLTGEWASAMKEVIQNNMTKLAEELEKALTDGIGFEFLIDEFDKLNTRQEEYLTKTNQIYETNKLIRQASQKIDQTDNKVAKQKMQNFVEETKSLQQNNQLSEYELEIQQAKYELLLAEIALEEAQNAKSTVRMQRDSEGNFGYVYTADQDAVDDAEQGLDDAKNRLYNISLEGQQEYTEKYLQAQQSMFDELAELQQMFLDGEITTQEEYERRKEAIVQHYYGEGGVLWTYSKLYNVAVQTDAAATADYWGKEYGEMTQHTEDWQIAVNDYLEQVEDETEDWADVSEKANRVVEGALKDSKTATKDLTDESGNLSKKIRNDLLPAMEKEYERIIKNTKEYGKERDAILEMIAAYEKYLELTNQEIKDESNKALNSDDHFKKDYSLSALINAAEGDMDAAYKDIDKRNEKIKDDGNYSDKTSSTTKKKVDAVDKLSDSQKEAIASSLKYLEEQGKYTTEQVDIILKQNGASFDTGGFTGVWGPEGKLAFLHQKELVLNEHDTDNMLNTVSMIRELVSMIDAGAAGSMISGLLSTPGFTNMLNHDFQQNVEIYAEFPDATDHSEIEQAFNNLLNTASQYANRKI